MRFVDNIAELGYYTTDPNAPCYCEQLSFASDLTLQAQLDTNATTNFTYSISVYSADGLVNYEGANPYFSILFFQHPTTGRKAFNLRLNAFSPAMCAYKCWILRVTIEVQGSVIFDKYTDRYCQSSCCDIPRGMTIRQEGVSGEGEFLSYEPTPATPTPTLPSAVDPPVFAPIAPNTGDCGQPLIRITVDWPCYDPNSGYYYGLPTTIYGNGEPFAPKFVLNMPGRIVPRPRTINREISFNCRNQRSESFRPFFIEGRTEACLMPAWKVAEVEHAFHAPEIIVDGKAYQWEGGVLFRQPTNCLEVFKLETNLQSCTVRVDHGCGDPCSTARKMDFVVPGFYRGLGFYDENRQPFTSVADYFASRANVESVVDVTAEYPGAAEAYEVTGFGNMPSYFYFDSVRPANRVFGADPGVVKPTAACNPPTLAFGGSVALVCATPEISYASAPQPFFSAPISYTNGWEDAGGSYGNVSGGIVTVEMAAINESFPTTDGTQHTFTYDLVGYIAIEGAPTIARSVDAGGGTTIWFQPDGAIYITGPGTSPAYPGMAAIFITGKTYSI